MPDAEDLRSHRRRASRRTARGTPGSDRTTTRRGRTRRSNPRSIAERAGLARSSFYEYFGSRDDILAAVAIAAFDRWAAEIDEVLAGAPESDRMHAYVEAVMRMTADGKHSIAAILQQADISPSKYDDIMALHTTLLRPINTLLRETGVADADAYAALIQGLLNAGVQLVTHGVDPDAATAMIADLLAKGLPADTSI